jgi:GntR family transcriptional regulator, transcriptional repressor for pyruvate dehydrogenase complex
MFTSVKTRRTFEEAVEQIAEAIRAGDLHAGDRLPSERTLAAQMGISRPTLREAIKVLADSGIVEVKPGPGGGMFVRSDLVPAGLIAERSELRISEISGVLEARRLLEPRVAQLAALYATEDDLDAMRRTIDLQRECPDDRERFIQLDLRFHMAIARATKNATIVALMRSLLRRLEIARDMAIRGPHEPESAIAIHEHTLQAIMGGDPETIEAAMDEHLSFLEHIWEEESGRARLRKIPDFLLPRAERESATALAGASLARADG